MNVLITGGASGLGEAITRKIASNPDNVVYFTYSNSFSNAQVLEKELGNTHSIKCDFRNSGEVNSLKEKINELNLDVLINNAYSGTLLQTHFHKIPIDDFCSEFMFNIIPGIVITQEAINCFRKKKSGKIITILTSALVNTPPIGWSGYVAGKAYLSSLVKSWAVENSRYNITSNSVSPSFMQTHLTSVIDERLIEQMITNHPLKKLLKVEEVAETILFLINSSTHINGCDIVMNGGGRF